MLSADLVFAPTSAAWRFRYWAFASHYYLSRVCITHPDGLTSKPHHAHRRFGRLTWIASPAAGIDFQPQTRQIETIVIIALRP